MKNSPRRFLKDELKLHQDPSLKKQAQIRNTINASDPNSIIGTLMDKYQHAIVQSLDDETRPLEKVRAFLYKKALLKEKDIPESYRDLQAKILRNNGQGAELEHGKFPQHARAAQAQLLINDQRERLTTWFDYLASADALYPIELKYWTLRSLIKLETFDKERGKFPKRSKSSVASFPELNHEALALLMDTQTAKIAGRALRNPGLNEEDFATFQKAKSFADLYALCLKASLKENKEWLENIKGEWIKYPRGSDPDPLVESLKGQSTGRCTAGYDTAKHQLQDGDFYVYYSEIAGKNTKPRLAIRMEGENIAEVRGIAEQQNLDPYITPVLEEKMQKFGEQASDYQKKMETMKKITLLEQKSQANTPPTDEEIELLYTNETCGFGYWVDPRLVNLKNHYLTALSQYFSKIKIWHWALDLGSPTSLPENFKLPESIKWNLSLGSLTSLPENFKLPENIEWSLDLRSLTTLPENFKLPKVIKWYLSLGSLTSLPENFKLPESIEWNLSLNSLTSLPENFKLPESIKWNLSLGSLTSLPENFKLPENIEWSLDLRSLTTLPENSKLPESIEWNLSLNSLTSLPENFKLPESIKWSLDLRSLTTLPENSKLPESIGWSLSLDSLTSLPENCKLPENIEWSLDLRSLTTLPENFKLPESIGWSLSLGSLTSLPENFKLPESIEWSLSLDSLTSLPENFKLPKVIKWYLSLGSLTSLPENCKLPKVIKWYLDLNSLSSLPENFKLPESIGWSLSLDSLTSLPENCKLPETLWYRTLDKLWGKGNEAESLKHFRKQRLTQ